MNYLHKYNKYYSKLNKNIQKGGASPGDIIIDVKNPQRILGMIQKSNFEKILYHMSKEEKEMQRYIYNLDNGDIIFREDENIKWKILPKYIKASLGDIVGIVNKNDVLGKIVDEDDLHWKIQFNREIMEINKDDINVSWRVILPQPTAKIGDFIYDILNPEILGYIVSDDPGRYYSVYTYTLDNGQKIRKDTQLVHWRVYLPYETKNATSPSFDKKLLFKKS